MKAILIARVSTEEQRDAGNSLPAQVARLERYCNAKGFEIIQVCSFDESAYSEDRYEFDRIIDLILTQTEKIVVCCDKVDRLSRNVFDKRISVLYERALNDSIELHFISDGQTITSQISAVEKFQFSISLGLAKYYSDAISDNVRRAMEQKLRKGEWLSKAPFGYRNVKSPDGSADVAVEEYEAHIIKQTFELYATGAYSMNLLLVRLKKDYGITWPKGQLAKILNNPFYHGIMLVKGKEYPHRYPPLISKALFNQVQQVKNTVVKQPAQYGGVPCFYRGMIRCAHCGLSITPEHHKNCVYYHCTQYNGKHGAKWLREDEITRQFAEVFKNLQMPEDIVEQVVETLKESHKDKMEFHNKQHAKLTKKQKEITKILDNLYIDKLKGSITESEYDRFYQSFRNELEEISAQLDQMQDAEDNYYITSRYVLSLTQRAYELFKSSEVEERRQLIKLVLSNVQFEDGNIVYQVQKPFDSILKLGDRQLWRD